RRQLGVGALDGSDRLADLGQQLHLLGDEHRAEEVALVAEVVIERAARHARLSHDLLGAHARVPARAEELAAGGDQGAPRGLRALGLCGHRHATLLDMTYRLYVSCAACPRSSCRRE